MDSLQDIEIKDRNPIYKQLVDYIETSIIGGSMKPGEFLPSINQLAKRHDISRETVKKAYGILLRRGLLESRQGKGFFVRTGKKGNSQLKIIVLTDRLSPYRQIFMDSFSELMGRKAETHILLHNQDVDLMRYYLDQALGKYDYYIVMPHFPRNLETEIEVLKQLNRIPKRQLILADKNMDSLPGNYGAVYQDFSQDIFDALSQIVGELRGYKHLDVFTMRNCLYGDLGELSIARFCDKFDLHASFHGEIKPKDIHKDMLCLFLNSQADQALFTVSEVARENGLEIGRDIKIISYNESPACALLLGGLSTVSADFDRMGRLCAEMILSGNLEKIKCPFRITRRRTF